MGLEHYAAIDIGTNAARLFVGYVQNKKGNTYVKKVSLIRIPLRLGEDVFKDGMISDIRRERFKDTMMAYKHIMKAFDVKAYRACATSAMREAKNGKEVREYIAKTTGINVEIIEGEEEANIIFSNFFTSEYDQSRSYLFIDVGGGSTELTVLKDGERIASCSFKLGTLRMLQEKLEANIWDEIKAWIDEQLNEHGEMSAIGSGGNINKIFKLMEKKQHEMMHIHELESMERFLNGMALDERIDKLRLKPDRADVIVPAARIYIEIMKMAEIDQMLVPKTGLADALVYQLHASYQTA